MTLFNLITNAIEKKTRKLKHRVGDLQKTVHLVYQIVPALANITKRDNTGTAGDLNKYEQEQEQQAQRQHPPHTGISADHKGAAAKALSLLRRSGNERKKGGGRCRRGRNNASLSSRDKHNAEGKTTPNDAVLNDDLTNCVTMA